MPRSRTPCRMLQKRLQRLIFRSVGLRSKGKNVQKTSHHQYLKVVEEHLERHRPKEFRELKASGALSRSVKELAEAIADQVNAELPEVSQAEPLEKRLQKERTALVMAESEALRMYLPMAESEEAKIGPNGGYVD